MAGNWIPSGNDQQRLTSALRGWVEQLKQVVGNAQILTNIMAQMAPGGDFSTLETYFSIPTGLGTTVKDLVGSASNDLNTNGLIQGVIQRLG